MTGVILSDKEVNNILNEQDKEIKSLKKENEQLKKELKLCKMTIEGLKSNEEKFKLSLYSDGTYHVFDSETLLRCDLDEIDFNEVEISATIFIDNINTLYEKNEQLRQQLKDCQIKFRKFNNHMIGAMK